MATKKKKKTPAKKAAKKAVKKTAKKTAKKAAKKTAKKATPKTAKKASKKVAKKSTKKAATKATKKAATNKAKKAPADAKRTATLVQHVFIAARPEQVYEALTDPTQHGAFTGTIVTGTPVVGGTFVASSGYIHGTFEKLEPNKLIVQSWTTTEWPKGAPPSRLEISLDDAGDGTELTMTHSDLPLSQAENYRQGWVDYYWNPLRSHFGKN